MEVKNSFRTEPFDCYCIGSLHGELVRKSGNVGRVINVFERIVNIRTTKGELLTVTLDKTRSPVNLNANAVPEYQLRFSGLASESQDVMVKVDYSSTIPRTVLYVGSISISVDAYDIFQNSLQQPSSESLYIFAAAIDRLFSVLTAEAGKRKGCLLNPDFITKGLLVTFLGRVTKSVSCNNQELLVDALVRLCGRGPGFTPAGDDFIAGYLAVSNLVSSAWDLGQYIIPGREFAWRTTWTSFKLMTYAANGLLDDTVQLMINSASEGSVADYVQNLKYVGKRGHTSGIDFATGSTIGLCVAADTICGTRTLDHILKMLSSDQPSQLS